MTFWTVFFSSRSCKSTLLRGSRSHCFPLAPLLSWIFTPILPPLFLPISCPFPQRLRLFLFSPPTIEFHAFNLICLSHVLPIPKVPLRSSFCLVVPPLPSKNRLLLDVCFSSPGQFGLKRVFFYEPFRDFPDDFLFPLLAAAPPLKLSCCFPPVRCVPPPFAPQSSCFSSAFCFLKIFFSPRFFPPGYEREKPPPPSPP